MSEQIQFKKSETFEADIERISREIQAGREHPKSKSLDETEILKQSIKSAAQTPLATVQTQNDNHSTLPVYANAESAEVKLEVEHLVEMAFREGLKKANSAAAKSNPFVLDAFHDALTGHLYPELKKRGILK